MKEHVSRVEHLLQKELGAVIQEELDMPQGVLVSITKTDVSRDMHTATVYVSVWPDEAKDDTLKLLRKASGYLYSFLEKRMRVHPLPKLRFAYDKSIAQASRIYSLMSEDAKSRKPDTDAGVATDAKES